MFYSAEEKLINTKYIGSFVSKNDKCDLYTFQLMGQNPQICIKIGENKYLYPGSIEHILRFRNEISPYKEVVDYILSNGYLTWTANE